MCFYLENNLKKVYVLYIYVYMGICVYICEINEKFFLENLGGYFVKYFRVCGVFEDADYYVGGIWYYWVV